MRIPKAMFGMAKEILRHVLRRPVVGIAAFARTEDGRIVLVRRGDTGEWAMPGGTLEWGETLRDSIARELFEEAGVHPLAIGDLRAVYSRPDRDARFHAVTIIVDATVSEPDRAPLNPLEILEVRLFRESDLPSHLAHGMTDMLHNARTGGTHWE